MKQYKVSFVVGKFSPLHYGHQYVINEAHEQSEHVVILSYTDLPGTPSAELRRLWLATKYPSAAIIVPNSGFPTDSATEYDHRKYCYNLCKQIGMFPDAIFGSETYINGFVEDMSTWSGKNVVPVIVDLDRKRFPVSGTFFRENPDQVHQSWLISALVSNTLTYPQSKRIAFLGAESSGKTTIAKYATDRYGYQAQYVREYGRTLWEEQGSMSYEDMLKVGRRQVYEEEIAMLNAREFLFCDTTPLTTKFYSQEWYGKVAPELDILAQRKYDIIFLCQSDFGYVEDGTRNGVEFGQRQLAFYKSSLPETMTFPLSGTVEERFSQIEKVLGNVRIRR